MTTSPPINKNLQALATATTAIMAIVLGLTIAYSIMQAITPRAASVAVDATPLAVNADVTGAYSLFGKPATANIAAPAIATSTSAVVLKGVFAVNGTTLSAAIINTGSKDKAVLMGEELEAGLKLTEVGADYIVLTRGITKERVELAARVGAASAKAGQAAAGVAGANTAANSFKLSVNSSANNSYSLSRQELNASLQDPRQLGVLGRVGMNASGSGVRVQDAPAGSLSEKLGLRPNDVIVSINGAPITGPGDLARLYQQFATTSQIRAEVTRGGTPVTLTYNIQ